MSTNDARIHVDGAGLAHAVIPVQDTKSLWRKVKRFVKKTHDMIEKLTEEGGKVASWMDDGKTFVIRNKSELESQFRRFRFDMKQYKSFERQLNNYSFEREHQKESFESNVVIFSHPEFHRNKPAKMVRIVDQRSIKASPKRKNVPVVSEEAETLGNKVARLESRVDELESKIDLMYNKILELSDSLLRNASNERVCPNMDDDCANPGTITDDDGLSSEDSYSSEGFDPSVDFEILRVLLPEDIRSLSPLALSTDNPDWLYEIEPTPYPPMNH